MFGNRNGHRGGYSSNSNRPVCQFYLEGRCRYGNSCKNEHPSGQGPASQNRFAALGSNNNYNNDRGRPNAFGNATADSSQTPIFSLTADNIRLDLTDERPIWPLSAYGPGKNAPKELLDASFEQSPEEVRLLHYMAIASGDAQQTPQREAALMQNIDNEIRKILNDLDGAVKYIVDGKDQHPNRLDLANNPSDSRTTPAQQSTGFGTQQTSSFGQPSAFGKNATTSSFGQPSSLAKPSPFGQPVGSQTTSAFGQASSLGQTSAFGKPSALGQPSAFGAPSAPSQTSAFGQPSALGAKPAFGQPAFGQPSQPAQTSTFGQPSQPAQTSTFGQPSQPAQTSAFGQPSQPGHTSAFGQPSQLAQTSTFGQPSQPAQTSAFGRPSQPGSGFGSSSPFGQQTAKQASPFANTAGQQQSAFGQPSAFGAQAKSTSPFANAGQQRSAFGSPSPFGAAASTNPSPFASAAQKQASPFATNTPQQSSPFASANQTTSTFGQPTQPTQPSAFAANDQAATVNGDQASTAHLSRDGSGRLASFKGRPISFNQVKGTNTVRNPFNNKEERIWFPDGPPGPTADVQASENDYQGDLGNMLKRIYEFVAKEGVFENGIMPEIPPRREWVAFDI